MCLDDNDGKQLLHSSPVVDSALRDSLRAVTDLVYPKEAVAPAQHIKPSVKSAYAQPLLVQHLCYWNRYRSNVSMPVCVTVIATDCESAHRART